MAEIPDEAKDLPYPQGSPARDAELAELRAERDHALRVRAALRRQRDDAEQAGTELAALRAGVAARCDLLDGIAESLETMYGDASNAGHVVRAVARSLRALSAPQGDGQAAPAVTPAPAVNGAPVFADGAK